MPKTPALTPIPSVRTPTAVSVNPGCLRRRRALYRRSCQMVRIREQTGGPYEMFRCLQHSIGDKKLTAGSKEGGLQRGGSGPVLAAASLSSFR